MEYAAARKFMVDGQLRPNKVTDPGIPTAMGRLPRHSFVPAAHRARAHADADVPLPGGRAMMQPMVLARLVQALSVRLGEAALVVGAATGYAAALLADLAGHVVALDCDAALVAAARAALADTAVEMVEGPLAEGWAAGGPYDLIFIDGLIGHVPDALVAQLAEGGRLAAAIEDHGASRLGIGRRSGTGFGVDLFADCEAVRLPGFDRPRTFTF